jgi:type II secretion system protein G
MAESTVVACPNCGKKYKIGTDKLGRTFKCTGCETRFQAGAEPEPTPPPVEEPAQESYSESETDPQSEASYDETANQAPTTDYSATPSGPVKTSGMAIASLICGILGCIPGAQIAAVILGLVSLKKINKGLAGGKALAIIGIILGVVGIGSYAYGGYMFYKGVGIVKAGLAELPHILTTTTELSVLKSGLDAFQVDNGRYPTTVEGLQALVTKPDGDLPNWKHSYLDKLPVDGWNHPFVYNSPGADGKDFDLYSLGGPDGKRIDWTVNQNNTRIK